MAGFDCPAAVLPVAGIQFGVVSAGIKTAGRRDLVLMAIASDATVAGMFTQNAFCAAPVTVSRQHLAETAPRYLLINTGNANAGTGSQGLSDARRSCEALAELAGVQPHQVLPFSTGVIGEYLPMERLLTALPAAQSALASDSWLAAAEGIMTTDTRPKAASRTLKLGERRITLSGIAKGAGMIRPNMATMLAFFATDAPVAEDVLKELWQDAVECSFNRVTVDGDTSTNDAAILVATGKAGGEPLQGAGLELFRAALLDLALELAQALVRDGEGASKFVAVSVQTASTEQEALEVAYTIAHSPLVKTALFASDPNWGRLLAAIGRADVPDLDVDRIDLKINDVLIATRGQRAPDYTEAQGAAAMAAEDITITVSLSRGEADATVWTSDLSYDYVRINAEYRT